MAAFIAEILAHRASGVWSDVLHRRRVRRGRRNHDAVLHGAEIFKRLHHLRNRRALLPDGDVDANDIAALLVDDGVQRHRGFACLAIADDQLALAAADRDHRVDGLNTGLERLFHRLPVNDAGRDDLDGTEAGARNRPLAVDRHPERIHDASDQPLADRHRHNAAGAADFVAFLDLLVLAQQHCADLVFFEVQRDAGNIVRKLDQLAGHYVFQTVNASDAVADGDNRAGFGNVDGLVVILNLAAQYARDLIRSDLSHNSLTRRRFVGELALHCFELTPDRAVVYGRADTRLDAANQRRVDGELRANSLARHARQPGFNRLLLGSIERLRGRYLRAHIPQPPVELDLQRFANRGKQAHTMMVDENE